MATSLVYSLPNGQTSSITFDACTEQGHESENDVTAEPVESGAPTTDNSRPMQRKVTLQVLVTNTPLKAPPDQFSNVTESRAPVTLKDGTKANLLQWSAPFDRVAVVERELDRLRENGVRVQLVTSLKTYDDMVIRSLSIQRTNAYGNALHAQISLVQVRVINTQTSATPSVPLAARRRARGNQHTDDATETTPEPSSMLANLLGRGTRVQ